MNPKTPRGPLPFTRRLYLWVPQLVLSAFARHTPRYARLNAAIMLLYLLAAGLLVAGGIQLLMPTALPEARAVASEVPGVSGIAPASPVARKVRLQGLIQSREVATHQEAQSRTQAAEIQNLLQLRGILGGDKPRAIVWHKASDSILYLSEGERIDEFEVVKIGSNSITLRFMGQEFDLPL